MEKQAELRDPKSCLNKAAAFEPIFVLRAKDAHAAQTVRLWAAMAVNSHEPQKVDSALALAEQMDKWRSANVPQACDPAPVAEYAKDRDVRALNRGY